MKIKYDYSIIKMVNKLFPEDTSMKMSAQNGDRNLLDMVYNKIGFHIDEDDVLVAFRNKKEQRILDMAKRAKAIRDLYQKIFLAIENDMNELAENHSYQDCL